MPRVGGKQKSDFAWQGGGVRIKYDIIWEQPLIRVTEYGCELNSLLNLDLLNKFLFKCTPSPRYAISKGISEYWYCDYFQFVKTMSTTQHNMFLLAHHQHIPVIKMFCLSTLNSCKKYSSFLYMYYCPLP